MPHPSGWLGTHATVDVSGSVNPTLDKANFGENSGPQNTHNYGEDFDNTERRSTPWCQGRQSGKAESACLARPPLGRLALVHPLVLPAHVSATRLLPERRGGLRWRRGRACGPKPINAWHEELGARAPGRPALAQAPYYFASELSAGEAHASTTQAPTYHTPPSFVVAVAAWAATKAFSRWRGMA